MSHLERTMNNPAEPRYPSHFRGLLPPAAHRLCTDFRNNPQRTLPSCFHCASARPTIDVPVAAASAELRIGCVDHHDFGLLPLGRRFGHDRGEHAHPAPPLPTVAERLRRPIGRGCVLPHQPIALNEDYPNQHPAVINPWLAAGLRKERTQPVRILHARLLKGSSKYAAKVFMVVFTLSRLHGQRASLFSADRAGRPSGRNRARRPAKLRRYRHQP